MILNWSELKTMKRRLFAIAAVLSLVTAASATAATVKFTLTVTPGPNTWVLDAEELDGPADNGGMASYGVVLAGVSPDLDHKSPRDGFGQGPGGVGPAGFTTLRSLDGIPVILASQDTTTPTPNLIYGFGQSGSSFAAKGIVDFTAGTQLESPIWGKPLVLASGTYQGATPSINATSADTFSNVFIGQSGGATRAAQIQAVTVIVPEPATAAMGGAGLLSLLAVVRRRRA